MLRSSTREMVQANVLTPIAKLYLDSPRKFDVSKWHFPSKNQTETQKVKILTAGSRIIAFDQQESAFFVKYKIKENQLNIFADDTYPR